MVEYSFFPLENITDPHFGFWLVFLLCSIGVLCTFMAVMMDDVDWSPPLCVILGILFISYVVSFKVFEEKPVVRENREVQATLMNLETKTEGKYSTIVPYGVFSVEGKTVILRLKEGVPYDKSVMLYANSSK